MHSCNAIRVQFTTKRRRKITHKSTHQFIFGRFFFHSLFFSFYFFNFCLHFFSTSFIIFLPFFFSIYKYFFFHICRLLAILICVLYALQKKTRKWREKKNEKERPHLGYCVNLFDAERENMNAKKKKKYEKKIAKQTQSSGRQVSTWNSNNNN